LALPVAAAPPLAWRQRAVLLGALALVSLLAWGYLARHAAMPIGMPMAHGAADAALVALMWVVMMAAMMLPSVLPTVLVHAAVSRQRNPTVAGKRNVAFIGGYVVAWCAFALAATALQIFLGHAALLSAQWRAASPVVGAALLVGAALWQLTPVKDTCLRRCRMPLLFVAEHWREGVGGAWRMGLWHGAYCIGCCGMLMALLFVGGVMNLLWVALIAGFVLLEKTSLVGGRNGRRLSAAGLLAGAALVASSL
jgi:predicted metal-binding membrane protein